MHPSHREILTTIQKLSGKSRKDAFLNSYLGNNHPLYAIKVPAMRKTAKDWMRSHRSMAPGELVEILTSLVRGASCTEKLMAGIMLNVSARPQRKFDPAVFDRWLEELVGWVEVDTICTGDFTVTEIPEAWTPWKRILIRFSKSSNIQKRRASLVLFCSPLRYAKDERLLKAALNNIERLKEEKEVLITKAISWVLRSATVHHKNEVRKYVALNKDTLPKIAVRETLAVLKTGKKTK
jgi:3-methyladenine DNA glycosylase AlkD